MLLNMLGLKILNKKNFWLHKSWNWQNSIENIKKEETSKVTKIIPNRMDQHFNFLTKDSR